MSAPQDNLFLLSVSQADLEPLMKVIPSLKFIQVVGQEYQGMQAICTALPQKIEEKEFIAEEMLDDKIEG